MTRIIQGPLFSEDECKLIAMRVDGLRPRWTTRQAFFTLGSAAYLDAREDVEEYFKTAAKARHDVLDNFLAPIERCARLLERITGREGQLATQWAPPGFHIFQGGVGVPTERKDAHVDVQYKYLGVEPQMGTVPVSLTVAIELPGAGAGLRVWLDDSRLDYVYRVGYYTCQLGLVPHAILGALGPRPEQGSTQRRLTMQMHGVVIDDKLRVYW